MEVFKRRSWFAFITILCRAIRFRCKSPLVWLQVNVAEKDGLFDSNKVPLA